MKAQSNARRVKPARVLLMPNMTRNPIVIPTKKIVRAKLPDLFVPAFDAESHRYFDPARDNAEVPGVNRLLRQAGFVDESYFYDEVRRRGKFVHAATRLVDDDDLGWVDPAYEGFVNSYIEWKKQYRPQWFPDGIEQPVGNRLHGWCGTPDRFGIIRDEDWCVEFKAGVFSPWHELQIAGYVPLRKPRRGRRWRRAMLYLQKNGKAAKFLPVDERPTFDPVEADRQFMNALSAFHWRLGHGDRSCFADRTEGQPVADFGIGFEPE